MKIRPRRTDGSNHIRRPCSTITSISCRLFTLVGCITCCRGFADCRVRKILPKRNLASITPTCTPTLSSLQSKLTLSASPYDNLPGRSEDDSSRRRGLLVLLTVPFAWGSFEPATKYIYSMDPPVPGFLFSLAYYSVAAISLFVATAVSSLKKGNDLVQDTPQQPQRDDSWPIRGGIELGLYLFVGNALQVLGLRTVPADRAAFLLQMTTLIVPLLEATYAGKLSAVRARTWLACGVALAGVLVIGLDGNDSIRFDEFDPALILGSTNFSSGDLLVFAAAVAYSFHCLRLEGYAKNSSAVKLAASKATTETLCSLFAVTILLNYASLGENSAENTVVDFMMESGAEISTFTSNLAEGLASGQTTFESLFPAFVAVLWTGLVTVAYTIYAQSYGQSRVRPATANLIYTFQPVCTALFAWALLGETLGPAGVLGGSLIGSAVLLEVLPPETKQEESSNINAS